jgi:hypothetical protein
MKKLVYISALCLTVISCKSSKAGCDAYSSHFESTELEKSLDVLVESAKDWSPSQKKEFANTFFIERGGFKVPTEPIVMETFKRN